MVRRLLLILLLSTAWSARAEVTARVDANPVLVGEAFTLELVATGDVDGEPDFSALQRDFRILNRSSGSRFSIVNGRSERSRNWSVVLLASQAGEYTIPPIRIGGDSSEAIRLRVREPEPNSDDPKLALVEMEITPQSVYVGQPLQITVRALLNGDYVSSSLSEPIADNAVIERLGDQVERSELRGNTRYRVYERRYIAFPEAAGELSITAPVFQGEVSTRRGSRSPLGMDLFGGPRQPVVATTADRRVPVRPAPSGAERPWLPSTGVQLAERLVPEGGEYRVGEPLTRELRLTVDGQLHTQIDPIEAEHSDDFQAYADAPESETLAGPAGVRATQTRRWALIPARAGELELPAVRVPWWDVTADRQRVAEVPARTITVLPAAGSSPAPGIPAGAESAVATGSDGPATAPAAAMDDAERLRWQAATLVLLLAWLLTLLAWWRRERKTPDEDAAAPRPSPAAARRELEAALDSGDPRRCRAALLAWADRRFDGARIRGLAEFAARCPDEAGRQALKELDAAAWARSGDWSAERLREAIEAIDDSAETPDTEKSPLPPLYPS